MPGLPPISTLATSGVVDVVFNADQTRVYIALANGTIELFDLETQAKLSSWQVSGALNSISLAEDGTFLLATNPNLPVVLRIATDTGQVTTSYSSTGNGFRDVEVVDSRTAIVTGGQSLSLDLVTGAMTPLANAAFYSSNSILSEDRHLTLLGEMGISNGPLAIYDDRTGTIVARGDNYQTISTSNATGFNNGIQAISENAGLVLQFIYHNSVNIYDLSLKFLRTVRVTGTANGLTFDESGRFVFVHLLGDSSIAAIVKYEIATWTEVERYPLGAGSNWSGGNGMSGNQLQITDDGDFLTVFDSSGKMQLVDLRATDDTIDGTAGSDRLFGGAGADVIRGAGGNDVLGSAGMLLDSAGLQVAGVDLGEEHDQLFGDEGDDLLAAGYGDDVDGGTGIDTLRLSLAGATAGQTVDTAAFVNGNPVTIGGGTIRGIESLQYLRGSDFADVIWIASQAATATVDGAGGNDFVISSGGAVVFRGGLGDDLFVTGSGLETFDGGDGEDTIDYRNAGAGVEVRLNATPGGTAVGPGGDSIVNVEGINGTGLNDRLFGSDAANRLNGAAGNDEISGGLGNDTLNGDAGDDTIDGGGGDDALHGGLGFDTLSYASAAAGVTVNFGLAGAQNTLGAGTDTLSGFETLVGSNHADRLTAGTGFVTIRGGAGNDVLIASADGDRLVGDAGDDTFVGGAGNDQFDGGEGFDTADYSAAAGGVMAGPGSAVGGASGVDNFAAIERLVGSNFADQLSFAAVMAGGVGNDAYKVSSGHQVVESAGQGIDRVEAWNASYTLSANVENLSLHFDPYAGASVAPEAALDGTGNALDNVITGSGGANQLKGMAGHDTLTGGAGIDALTGGTGNDTFRDTAAGLSGDTIVDLALGDRIVISDASLAGFNFSLSGNTLTYTGGSLTLGALPAGRIVATAAAGGGVELAIAADARHDFNGDGRSDLAWLNTNGTFMSWLGQANGGFDANPGSGANALPTSWRIAGSGDFNGDGSDDLLWRHSSGEIGQWLGRSNGVFANNGGAAANPVPTSWAVAGVADYNGDGRDDILWRHVSGEVGQWLGQPSGGFTNNGGAAANAVDPSWSIVASGDFNGDDRADVLWRHASGAFAEWHGTASGALVNAGAVLAGAGGSVVGSADFNSDGRDDVLMRAANGAITVWLGQASGQFTAFTPARQILDGNWKIVAIGDYNGDGSDDLLWRHASGEAGEWLATGTGDFAYNGAIPTVDPSWQIQSPDLFLV